MSGKQKRVIPGTTLFDGDMARKGYALNKMCFSFNSADCRAEFKADPAAYCDKWGLNEQQKKAVLSLQMLGNLDEDFSCANSRFFRTLLYSSPKAKLVAAGRN